MALIIESSLLEKHLELFFEEHSEDVFVLHTDIGTWGLLKGLTKRDEFLSAYWELLSKASKDCSLVFPLFNYAYGSSRRYDVLRDKCQVGIMNEYTRLLRPEKRTRTPIFNFIEWPNETFSLAPNENPFDESSLWGDLCRRDGRICFMGAGFSANTFIHFIEEKKEIGYRYLKPMPGVIVVGEEEEDVNFLFRVRPRVEGAVDYDWDRLETDLVRERFLDCHSLGISKVLSYNAKDVLDYWLARLEDDEFYFLTDASKAKIFELRRSKPYPFRFEDFEQETQN